MTTATASLVPFAPSSNVAQLKESATIAVSARARALKAAGRQVIDLGAGEPDFDTPVFIRRAAQKAIDSGATRYTATEGILPLREAIAAQANAVYRGSDAVNPGDIVVSTGSKQSLFNTCFVLFGAGDEVLVPTPSWTSYYEMVALAKAAPVPVFGSRSRGLKVTAGELADAATPRTRGVMLNSPSQHAAVAALTDTAAAEAAVTEMVRHFRARRDAAMDLLDAAGVQYVRPEGAFYLYIDVGGDGAEFATRLLDSSGIAVVPGSAFLTPEWVRVSYAAPIEHVVEGVRKLVAAL